MTHLATREIKRGEMNPKESFGIQEKQWAKTLVNYTNKPIFFGIKKFHFVGFVYKNSLITL